jgi:nucleotide-binding universal stress UspA family protein
MMNAMRKTTMKPIHKIMVAVDFSKYSLPAVRYAAGLARDLKAELLLVNVINQRDVDMTKKVAEQVPAFSFENYLEETRKDREDRFQQLINEAACEDLPIKTSIRIGVPYEELLLVIESKKPDLLVMATQGRSNLVNTIIGSCAQKMFRRCPIPLTTIRGDDIM